MILCCCQAKMLLNVREHLHLLLFAPLPSNISQTQMASSSRVRMNTRFYQKHLVGITKQVWMSWNLCRHSHTRGSCACCQYHTMGVDGMARCTAQLQVASDFPHLMESPEKRFKTANFNLEKLHRSQWLGSWRIFADVLPILVS